MEYNKDGHLNIPALLIVADVKRNRLFQAWLTPETVEGSTGSGFLSRNWAIRRSFASSSRADKRKPGLFAIFFRSDVRKEIILCIIH